MPTPKRTHQLHLVTEPRKSAAELTRSAAVALDGGVDWLQLRDKSASAAALFSQARELLAIAHQRGARLAVNDRLDVALAAGADGVHLAAQSLPVDAAVELARGRALVGRSVHSLDEAIRVAEMGADYVTFGHVFPTSTHPGLPPHGVTELAAIVAAVNVPVLAIGGITVDNLEAVLATGCAGVAVISAILSSPDPREAAGRLRCALDAAACQPRIPFPPVPSPAPTRSEGGG
ncbi:MAG: thiamine phosphate synthase [Chloroflexi bacterium]|nr:thiamine phosphate synthase [Chloroflexota bacterium]